MKKLLPHIIYILIIAFFIVYANIKANEAEKALILADINAQEAAKNAQDAKRLADLSEELAAQVRIQERRTNEVLEELEACKSKK
jgi:hypothetical protein